MAGDALLALAFESLATLADRRRVGPEPAGRMVKELATAVGFQGLVGGETADILGADRALRPAAVRSIHARKTARLFAAAARIGGHAGDAPPAVIERVGDFGMAIGAAFQIADDMSDDHVPRTRRSGQRARPEAPSFVSAVGLTAARRAGRRSLHTARAIARDFPAHAASFLALADLVEARLD